MSSESKSSRSIRNVTAMLSVFTAIESVVAIESKLQIMLSTCGGNCVADDFAPKNCENMIVKIKNRLIRIMKNCARENDKSIQCKATKYFSRCKKRVFIAIGVCIVMVNY